MRKSHERGCEAGIIFLLDVEVTSQVFGVARSQVGLDDVLITASVRLPGGIRGAVVRRMEGVANFSNFFEYTISVPEPFVSQKTACKKKIRC